MIEVGIILYVCVMAVTTRILTDHFAYRLLETDRESYPLSRGLATRPDGLNWAGGLVLALLASAVWPLVLAWQIRVPAVGAAARAKQVQQAERIRELEREAGL